MSIIWFGNRSVVIISTFYLIKESFLGFIDDIQVDAHPLGKSTHAGFNSI